MWPFSSGKTYDEEKDIPDLSGKVILVTGGNEGIGKYVCLPIVQRNPAHLYIASRDPAKAEDAIKEMRALSPTTPITFIKMDLSSFASIHTAAKQLLASTQRLDYLFLNAGIMAVPPALSPEGYEIEFSVNHVGHALLTKLLLPTLLHTTELPGADVRIILTSSGGHFLAPTGGILFDELRTPMANQKPMTLYGQTKLANILFAEQLAKRYPAILSTSIAPGVTESGMAGKANYGGFLENIVYPTIIWLMTRPTRVGAWSLLWAAFAPRDQVVNGEYYDIPFGTVGGRSKDAKSEKLAEELWVWTEKELANETL